MPTKPANPLTPDQGDGDTLVTFDEALGGTPVAPDAPGERRRYPRAPFFTKAVVIRGGWARRARVECRVKDLSQKGACLELSDQSGVAQGDPLHLELGSLPPTLHPSGQGGILAGRVVRTAPAGDGRRIVGVRFDETVDDQLCEQQRSGRERTILIYMAALIAVLIVVSKGFNIFWFWYDPVFQTYSLCVAAFILTRAGFCMFYREPPDRGQEPSVTVAIAVKDEEDAIAETVRRCLDSAYRRECMEIIVVDDGSTDGTWQVLTRLVDEFPQLRVFRFAENRGKRHAMALAAQQATGEILVYIDSDSFVERESIYRIVQPFADPLVGAVAGHIKIIVKPDEPLSKMELVRYFISHRVMKASESLFGAVTCCSGAFSAYRRSAVLEILHPWLNQMFLGTRSTFGDDRSLTNFILRRYHVVFHNHASAWTTAPPTWSKFFRQQLRWKKSWTRETCVAIRIMYRKHPVAVFSYYVGVLVTLISPLIVLRALIYMPIMASASCLPYLAGITLIYLFFCLIFRYHTGSEYWLYGLGFAALYLFVLCWQNYYAMLTVNRTHWGTR